MRTDVIERLRAAMDEAALDALIVTSPENFAYVTGFVVPSQPLMRWRHAAVVLGREGDPALLCVDMEETTLRERFPDAALRVWAEFGDDPMEALAGLARDLGHAGARAGVELDQLPAGDYRRLADRLPQARLVPCEGLLARQRQRKTAGEIERLRALSRIADRAIGDAFRAVRPGDTEMDLAAALTRSVYAQGAEQFKLMIVASGERSQLPNVGPSGRALAPGDVCRVEIFPVVGGYHAGVCRSAVVGHAPPGAERIWAHLVECKRLLLDRIRPGTATRAVWRAFLDKFGALGLPPIAFAGHGIGLHLHEEPYLAAHDEGVLASGMTLGVEPLVLRTGLGFGLQLKDMIAVTDDGCELLSDATDNDRLIVIE